MQGAQHGIVPICPFSRTKQLISCLRSDPFKENDEILGIQKESIHHFPRIFVLLHADLILVPQHLTFSQEILQEKSPHQ